MISKIEKVDGIYLKRNDLIEVCGCSGGKAECIFELMKRHDNKCFVTCGSRDSLQCEIVSQLCEYLGYTCHIFLPEGQATPTINRMRENSHTYIHAIPDGRMVVLKKRARDYAAQFGMTLIPFGVQAPSSVFVVASQTVNIPEDVKRIVVPVGGGITLCGIMQGLVNAGRTDVKVLGVLTGGNPEKTIRKYRPLFNPINYELVPWTEGSPTQRYGDKVETSIGDVPLDPVYEAKCKKFLQEGDLLWIVGYHEV